MKDEMTSYICSSCDRVYNNVNYSSTSEPTRAQRINLSIGYCPNCYGKTLERLMDNLEKKLEEKN
jgi:hypothetical protein